MLKYQHHPMEAPLNTCVTSLDWDMMLWKLGFLDVKELLAKHNISRSTLGNRWRALRKDLDLYNKLEEEDRLFMLELKEKDPAAWQELADNRELFKAEQEAEKEEREAEEKRKFEEFKALVNQC